MIKVKVLRGSGAGLSGFEVKNHGGSFVCAAVSMFSINTVNALETLLKEELDLKAREGGGYLRFSVKSLETGAESPMARLLLETMLLGLRGASAEYPGEIDITDKI
ncbi:MAG: ribosomal-processing cysteine protease Prp [Clostridiales bacterium]|nr:ribosomal-processing cysteine protease Prp [Clostridiales bacterium]